MAAEGGGDQSVAVRAKKKLANPPEVPPERESSIARNSYGRPPCSAL